MNGEITLPGPFRSENHKNILSKYFEAYKKVKAVLGGNEVNKHYRNKYVSKEKVFEEVRSKVVAEGLVISSDEVIVDGVSWLFVYLQDVESGEWVGSKARLVWGSSGNELHNHQSAITYTERYTVSRMFFIAYGDKDSDGNNAYPDFNPNAEEDNSKPEPKPKPKPKESSRSSIEYTETESGGMRETVNRMIRAKRLKECNDAVLKFVKSEYRKSANVFIDPKNRKIVPKAAEPIIKDLGNLEHITNPDIMVAAYDTFSRAAFPELFESSGREEMVREKLFGHGD
ncbi:MAG: hypothetical protein CMN21_24805 [Rubinisphaera sp.]|uniref:ERF family protein n=1 Tax=Rubinisphaera sp. TaxID=2024857 RepID=UPI000C0DF831|nr:ERF family protein [Rubinisphaera sp.]MBV12425.1 hypothetical protein [Rubinisphaera sp.]